MKNKNLEKLVIALRSGKYKQGTGRLNYNNEYFCCLGVACEVAIENGVKVNRNAHHTYHNFISYDEQCYSLPKSVKKYFNFREDVESSFGDVLNELTYLNDVKKNSFDEISNYIEQNEDNLTTKYD